MCYDERWHWKTCVHEAAHAVIAALGGAGVYEIAVAPLGSEGMEGDNFKYDNAPNHLLLGYCRTSNVGIEIGFSRWDSDEHFYRVDRPAFSRFMRDAFPRRMRDEIRRQLRAQVCLLLAGPIAEEILWYPDCTGTVPCEPADMDYPNDDFNKAMRTAELLSGRSEGWRLMDLTEAKLREESVWQSVLTLARQLSEKGILNDDIPLPDALGLDWPPPRPRRRSSGLDL
jgi:hypothetical protein